MALEAYFDGSATGDWSKGDAVTLAGFAAEDSFWVDFDKEWNFTLNDDSRRPKAPYLHMKEANSLSGPFDYKNGWKMDKVRLLVTDLLMCLQVMDKSRFRQFACTIDLKAHRKLIAEGYSLPGPIEICNGHCPTSVLSWYATNYPGLIHSAHYFFDRSEPFKPLFEARWNKKKDSVLDARGLNHVWSLIKTVTTADMKDKPALQAADLLAWACNRPFATKSKAYAAFNDLERVMKSVIPSTWVPFDEGILRWKYEDRKPKR